MEDLQRELEVPPCHSEPHFTRVASTQVVTCPKPCISTETQTEDPPEEVPEDSRRMQRAD